jgi:hypothetical protein
VTTTTNIVTWNATTNGDPGITVVATDTATVEVLPNLGLTLTLGVGLTPFTCATDTSLTVAPGTTVYYCYTATNTSDATLIYHEVNDGVLGLLPGFSVDLAPGGSTNTRDNSIIISEVITAATTHSGEWFAMDRTERTTSATASATVLVGTPAIAVRKFVAPVDACSTTSELVALAGSNAYFCVEITNTGDFTLTDHTINDPLLNINVTVPYLLAPGASVVLSNDQIAALGPVAVTANVTNTVIVTSVLPAAPIPVAAGQELPLPPEIVVTGSAFATVRVGTPAIEVTKLVAATDTCLGETEIQTPVDSVAYYCIEVTNTGDFTFTQHQIIDPMLNLSATLDALLPPGATLVISNDQFPVLGPVDVSGPVTNTVIVNSSSAGVGSVGGGAQASIIPDVPTVDTPTFEPNGAIQLYIPFVTRQ